MFKADNLQNRYVVQKCTGEYAAFTVSPFRQVEEKELKPMPYYRAVGENARKLKIIYIKCTVLRRRNDMIDMKCIEELYEESEEMRINNRGCIRMMLNRETEEVWNDFFVNSEDYKIYDDESIIAIPVNSIIDGASDISDTLRKSRRKLLNGLEMN